MRRPPVQLTDVHEIKRRARLTRPSTMNLVARKPVTENTIDFPEFVLVYAMKQLMKVKINMQACKYKNY
jgi:hypothetical protein